MEYAKENPRELAITETKPEKTVYSYDFILNSIQELTDKLAFFQNLKKEADKLGLKR